MAKKLLIVIFLLFTLVSATTKLGAWYLVKLDNTQYIAIEGDRSITSLAQGTKVRLIKDDSIAETIFLLPIRIIKLMVNTKPRGNWLVEDENSNRGYVWASELELVNTR